MSVKRAVAAASPLVVLAAFLTAGTPSAAGTVSCGDIGAAAFQAGGGPIYEVEGALRARAVHCDRASKIAHRYIRRTSGAGGRMRVMGFRCRGGPREGNRFIINCRREAGRKRIFLEGSGGPK